MTDAEKIRLADALTELIGFEDVFVTASFSDGVFAVTGQHWSSQETVYEGTSFEMLDAFEDAVRSKRTHEPAMKGTDDDHGS